ncbi:MAG: OmpA family protein [Gammaproteobacteria bacterium]|nr:OmpA family protein [Gammaproteobacteria bacterium]
MKTLLALLAAGVVVGAGYWKYQNPDGNIADLRADASQTAERLKGGLVAVRDGGPIQQNRLEKIDDLATNQETLRSELNSLSAAIENGGSSARAEVVDGRLLDAERRLDSFNAQMDTINSNSDGHKTQLTSLTETVSGLNGQIELLNRRLEEQANNDALNGINNDLQRLESTIETLQESDKSNSEMLTTRLSAVEDKASILLSRLNTLSANAVSDSDSDEDTASLRAQVDQRLQAVEQKFETTTTDSQRIETLLDRFNQTRKQLAQLDEVHKQSQETIAALQKEVDELRTRNESLSIDGLQDKIQQQLADVRKQIDSASTTGSTDVNSLNSALEATRNRIQNLEQRVQGLPATSNAASVAQEVQSSLEAQIASLESKLAEVSANPDLIDSISEVKQQVSALESDLRKKRNGETVTYKIYFDRGSTGISEDAAKVLNTFIAQEKNRTTGVSIFGFTDRRGTAEYNQRLALQRATNVRSYLIQKGFDYTKIESINGLGEDAAAASLEDGTEDAQQRTVVLFAAQP